ncbi:MAG: GntR family transcriptional regulator, partial [Rhodospirillaceae bacterium]|nr:GntR family transcriptional regulator [Rhodospirillaceae bacterium]
SEFGVSRVTVRQALRFLEQAGSVSRARGRGTIVSPPKFTRNVLPVSTLEQDFTRQGIAYETRILDFQRSYAPPEVIRERLKLSSRSTVGRLRLVRLVHGKIICFERRYCIPSLAKQLVPETLMDCGVVALLSKLVGSTIQMVEFETEITPSGEEVSAALGITAGTLMLQNTFVYFLDNGTPVETGSISYRVDRCKFRAAGRLASPSGTVERAPEQPSSADSSPGGRLANHAQSSPKFAGRRGPVRSLSRAFSAK